MAFGSAFLEGRLQTREREALPPPAAGGGQPGRERERGCRLWNLLPTPPLSFSPSLSLSNSAQPPAEKLVATCAAGLSFLEKEFDLKGQIHCAV